MEAGALIRDSRKRAGVTQAELARRLGTTQSAIARLERPRSNPRIETLERALLAIGQELDLRVRVKRVGVDEAQIRERLKLTPAERLVAFEESSRKMRRLLAKASRPRARSS